MIVLLPQEKTGLPDLEDSLSVEAIGEWTRQLAKLKVLRGTWLDPFGQTSERKQERALIDKYQNQIQEILKILASSPFEISDGSYQKSIELASLPQDIRGFGHVKAGHIRQAMEKWHCLASELVQLGGQSGSDKRPAP